MNTMKSTSKKDYEMKENTKNIYIFHRKNIDKIYAFPQLNKNVWFLIIRSQDHILIIKSIFE